MRLLWLLPKAAPLLLRHLMGYAELATQDLVQAERELGAQLLAAAAVAFSLFFVVLSGCLLVVALTWDTPNRVAAIAWMVAGFTLLAIGAWLYRSSVSRARRPFLSTVRREWREDRVILDHVLSSDEE